MARRGRPDEYPELKEFRDYLKGKGYRNTTISHYLQAVRNFMDDTLPVNSQSRMRYYTRGMEVFREYQKAQAGDPGFS